MKAILKGIWVDSADFSLENFQPEEENCFTLLVSISIGLLDEAGINYFQVNVCTPEWFCKHQWVPELMRHTMIVRKYDLDEITATINKCIEECTCDTWLETAQKLSRYFAWEFEDYQP